MGTALVRCKHMITVYDYLSDVEILRNPLLCLSSYITIGHLSIFNLMAWFVNHLLNTDQFFVNESWEDRWSRIYRSQHIPAKIKEIFSYYLINTITIRSYYLILDQLEAILSF